MILSVDDGCASDLRVADLARKYEIDTIFYWPLEWRSLAYDKGYEPLTYHEACSISQDFEIGSHGITHRHLTGLPELQALAEIAESRPMLESLFNRKITKFCPSRGYTNVVLTEFTLQNYESQRLTRGSGLVHIHPDSGANGNRPWRDCITEDTAEIWAHSWELDRYNLWDELEEFLSERAHS